MANPSTTADADERLEVHPGRIESQPMHAHDSSNDDTKEVKDQDFESNSTSSTSRTSWLQRASARLHEEIAHDDATVPLTWMALLTGLVDGLIYSRTSVWVGFQTGNIVTFSLGIANFIYPWSTTKPALLTLLRFLSFASFFVASHFGAVVGRELKAEKRRWYLMTQSMLQAVFLFGAAGLLWNRPENEDPSWQFYPPVIVFVALSMGLQSILAQKLSSPVFSTSVAYTATLTQIAADPHLWKPRLSLLGHKEVRGRDLRILAIMSLALGGGLAQTFLDSRTTGIRGGVMVSAAFKVVLSLLWLWPKGTLKAKA